MPAEITAEQARAAVLAGKTVRLEVHSRPRHADDPVLLVYVGLTITDEVPIQRESQTPVSTPEGSSDGR